MSFEGVIIDKVNGGLGRTSSAEDRVIALVYGINENTYTKVFDFSIKNYTATGFCTIEEVEAAGIKDLYTGVDYTDLKEEAAYALSLAQLWYHFDEMFRLAPGQEFYLITVPTTITTTTTAADATSKTVTSDYKVEQILANTSFINAVKGITDINVLGFANISDLKMDNIKYTSGSKNQPAEFQSFVDNLSTNEHLLIDGIFLEGKASSSFDFTDTDTNNIRSSSVEAPNVSVVIAQDPAMSGIGSPVAIGTVLGSVAIRKVHEDLGSVDIEEKPSSRKGEENYSLTDSSTGRWSSAQLSNGKDFLTYNVTEQANISNNGYIYVGAFKNYGGYYLSGCQTAVESTSDYSFFNFNCVWNKAARLIRTTLIPRVRSNVPVEASTGYIKSTTISYWKGLISKQLETMVSAGNISGFDIYINPDQTPDDSTKLIVKARLVTNRIVHEFEVELGLTDSLD